MNTLRTGCAVALVGIALTFSIHADEAATEIILERVDAAALAEVAAAAYAPSPLREADLDLISKLLQPSPRQLAAMLQPIPPNQPLAAVSRQPAIAVQNQLPPEDCNWVSPAAAFAPSSPEPLREADLDLM